MLNIVINSNLLFFEDINLKKKYKKIAVGGTFDKFHKGHEKLISTAFEFGEEVLIGITSDKFANNKIHEVESFEQRVFKIKNFVETFNTNYEIKEIFDANGSADVDSDLDAIVVSEETESSAENINLLRCDNGLNLLDIIVIGWIMADDGNPISSTRIRKGEINKRGKLL